MEEEASFCCATGEELVRSLPPLQRSWVDLLDNHPRLASEDGRALNRMFCPSVVGYTKYIKPIIPLANQRSAP